MADDNDRKARELELKKRAFQTLTKTQALKAEVDKQYAGICKYMNDYPDSRVDKMDWMEKEKVLAEADVLFEKLRECEATLKRFDDEYEELRKEVNEFYGREVMKKVLSDDFSEKHSFDADPPDPADWWKS
jgi:hypothetical protein